MWTVKRCSYVSEYCESRRTTGEKETYSDSARVCRDEAESDGGRFTVMTGGVVRDYEPRVSVLVLRVQNVASAYAR